MSKRATPGSQTPSKIAITMRLRTQVAHTHALPMICVKDSGPALSGDGAKAHPAAKKRRRMTTRSLTPSQTSAMLTSPSIPLVPPNAQPALNAKATDTARSSDGARVKQTARTKKTMSTLMMMISHPLLMTAAPLTR